MCGNTSSPIRVIMCILTATYSESVSCTPYFANGEPSGPMLKGITYKVLPSIQPIMRLLSLRFISSGSIQLLVGPASCLRRLQMKVLSSERATSLGSVKHAKLFGRFLGFKRINVPLFTSRLQRLSYSSREPSHQCMELASQS